MKLLFFDLETTGTNPARHGIHQISGIVEIDGVEQERFDFKVRPNPKAEILDEALAVTLTLWSERKELKKLRKSKDDLRESMCRVNYSLHQGIERLKREKHAQRKKLTSEIHALRTQLHQLRKDQQKQDNG